MKTIKLKKEVHADGMVLFNDYYNISVAGNCLGSCLLDFDKTLKQEVDFYKEVNLEEFCGFAKKLKKRYGELEKHGWKYEMVEK